jgi:hypothetical protein
MTLRWYTVVVDCHDPAVLAEWWRETLGWTKVYEADDEVVIVPPHLLDETFAAGTPWNQQNPGLVFGRNPDGKVAKNRLHIDLAPNTSQDRDAEIASLVARGATAVDIGQVDVPWIVLADPEGNEFCVLTSRDQ